MYKNEGILASQAYCLIMSLPAFFPVKSLQHKLSGVKLAWIAAQKKLRLSHFYVNNGADRKAYRLKLIELGGFMNIEYKKYVILQPKMSWSLEPNNQFRNYKFEFSLFFGPIKTTLLCLFYFSIEKVWFKSISIPNYLLL